MRTDVRYTPSDCFETFPFPIIKNNINQIGEEYYSKRQSIMNDTNLGLTKTYNRFNNKNDKKPDIVELRQLHAKMDKCVLESYGWTDLPLDHDFYETAQGMRFTICEKAKVEILDRLLALNHQRYAEEVAQGLHETKKANPASTRAGKSKKAKLASEDKQLKFEF